VDPSHLKRKLRVMKAKRLVDVAARKTAATSTKLIVPSTVLLGTFGKESHIFYAHVTPTLLTTVTNPAGPGPRDQQNRASQETGQQPDSSCKLPGSSPGQQKICSDSLRSFPHSLQANTAV
jgi:hypothetical protein